MQFMAFGGCRDTAAAAAHLAGAPVDGVLYEDLNDPRGVAVLALSRTPLFSTSSVRC